VAKLISQSINQFIQRTLSVIHLFLETGIFHGQHCSAIVFILQQKQALYVVSVRTQPLSIVGIKKTTS